MTGFRAWCNRSRPRAILVACLLVLAVTLALNVWLGELRPESRWGTTYGAVALALLLAAMAYAGRRRAPRRGPGRARLWLEIHVVSGTLFLALVLMHSGFRWPHGLLGWSLWGFSVYLVASGIVGFVLQQWIPRLLTSAVSIEVNFDRIPSLVDELRGRAEELVRSSDEVVQRYYEVELAPAFAGPQPRLAYFLNPAGLVQSRVRRLDHLSPLVEKGAAVESLRGLVTAKLEMDVHYTLQRVLRLWLTGHVPVSVVLCVLVGFHLFLVWYY